MTTPRASANAARAARILAVLGESGRTACR